MVVFLLLLGYIMIINSKEKSQYFSALWAKNPCFLLESIEVINMGYRADDIIEHINHEGVMFDTQDLLYEIEGILKKFYGYSDSEIENLAEEDIEEIQIYFFDQAMKFEIAEAYKIGLIKLQYEDEWDFKGTKYEKDTHNYESIGYPTTLAGRENLKIVPTLANWTDCEDVDNTEMEVINSIESW